MIGMLISGNMSTGMRSALSVPMRNMSSAKTMNVYGRLSAIRTMASMMETYRGSSKGAPTGADRSKLAKTSHGNSADPALAVRKRLVTKYNSRLSPNWRSLKIGNIEESVYPKSS
jgi:hypothetical protein